jgi:hypothetical protein
MSGERGAGSGERGAGSREQGVGSNERGQLGAELREGWGAAVGEREGGGDVSG